MKNFNPWPFGLFLTLAVFVVVQLGVVTLATTTFEGLDDVEYYRHGVEYGKEIARQKMQKELGWKLDTKVSGNTLLLAILDADGKPVTRAAVRATVGKPATIKHDAVLKLDEVGPGIYQTPLHLSPGEWRVRLEISKGDNLVKVEFRQRGESAP